MLLRRLTRGAQFRHRAGPAVLALVHFAALVGFGLLPAIAAVLVSRGLALLPLRHDAGRLRARGSRTLAQVLTACAALTIASNGLQRIDAPDAPVMAPVPFAAAAAGYAGVLALAAAVRALWKRTQRGHTDTVRTLMASIDAADPMTRGQSSRIANLSLQVGRRLGLDTAELAELEYAALLHEIGRTAIQRDLVAKPGSLSNQEQAVLHTHPALGSEAVQRFGFFPGAARIVLAHHEQPDGAGYPQGLRGDAIPLGSRILMATAAFDAMTSHRPYRRGLTPEVALERLLDLAGKQFFSDVVEALIDLYTSGALFDTLDAAELEHFAAESGMSPQLQQHLSKRGLRLASAPHEPEADLDDVPILELPHPSRPEIAVQRCDVGAGLEVRVAAVSDVGCKREQNEDSIGQFTDAQGTQSCLLVVADGMGGAAAGEVASQLAVERVQECYFADAADAPAGVALRQAMQEANEFVHARATSDRRLAGMGTTCTAVVIRGNELYVGHVGDSRAYRVRDHGIQLLTQDHTLAAELQLVTGGTPHADAHHVLTRCLGTRAEIEIDLAEPARVRPGDVIVLCSDGLYNQIETEEILALVDSESPGRACSGLVERALARGAPDNVSVVVASIVSKH